MNAAHADEVQAAIRRKRNDLCKRIVVLWRLTLRRWGELQ
jgi:hypothetical protein